MPRTKTIARPRESDSLLAQQIGQRIRQARLRAGLTQQQLAGERYTKAYVSALETGIARPSMVALTYLSQRLNLPPSHFLEAASPAWSRLEADLHLASGGWQQAADAYESLLESSLDTATRAEVLRGLAEAQARLDRGREAIAAATEASRLFGEAGRDADAALARYWLASGLFATDNEADARGLLKALLAQVRDGLTVEPDFKMRLLIALAAVEGRDGEHERALELLEEARSMADDLDDRRRGMFLLNLAISYRETGDLEAAVRVGTQAVALFRAADAQLEEAMIENDLALAYLGLGNLERARELAAEARDAFERAGDRRLLAAVVETEAQVALAAGDPDAARRLAEQSIELARESGNRLAELSAMLTDARAQRAAGEMAAAESTFRRAVELARAGGSKARLRDVLREWAGLRAEAGDHRGAYELTSEALAVN